MSKGNTQADNRPLSPHLLIYKPQMTSVLSILHRMTGVALTIGLFMVVWLLIAAASGPEYYNQFMTLMSSPVGLVLLFGWSFALFYHMCNGIRHLIWDTGRLFKIEHAKMAGGIVILTALLLTAAVWCYVWI